MIVANLGSGRRQFAVRKGRVSTVSFDDLDQGLITPEPLKNLPVEDVPVTYPTVVQQAKNNMRRLPHCVLLTKVGGFYELYLDHALTYGPLLNLKVAYKKTSAGPVAMAGFPFMQLDKFLKVLVQDLGKHVAISEETPRSALQKMKAGGLLFDRHVKRIITPGTLIDEHFLSPYEHNYLLAISAEHDVSETTCTTGQSCHNGDENSELGIAWLDLSSGDFFTQAIDSRLLSSVLARIAPKEVVIDPSVSQAVSAKVSKILEEIGRAATRVEKLSASICSSDWPDVFDAAIPSNILESFAPAEVSAVNVIVDYVQSQLPESELRLSMPIRQLVNEHVSIDRNSLRGLEILQTLRDGLFKGSLLQAIRRTSTESGARLLAHRIGV